MKIMCLDVGKVRIGIAQSDPMKIIASPLEVYTRTNSIKNDARYIAGLIKANEVDTLVVGLPKKLDGSEGDSVQMAKNLAERIMGHTTGGVKLVFEDERFSTVEATRVLLEGDVSRKKRKQVVDKIAATFILQSYLDRLNKKI